MNWSRGVKDDVEWPSLTVFPLAGSDEIVVVVLKGRPRSTNA